VKLGRAWGHFARVVFWETYFSSVVDPVEWDTWEQHGYE